MAGRIIAPSCSIWEPIHLGVDEFGRPVLVSLVERNILAGGEPGGGKSNALNLIVGHAALSADCRLVLIDGKRVEFGLWRRVVQPGDFVGNDINQAIDKLEELQSELDHRLDVLEEYELQKIWRGGWFDPIVVAIDELAYFSATIGSKAERERFTTLVRDLVARGRAAGLPMVAATQRPSADVIPTSLRDLFGYRWAFRCTTEASSDTILGRGWADLGYTATDIDPMARGVGYLLAEGGIPRRMKAAYLSNATIRELAVYAAALRGNPNHTAGSAGMMDRGVA
jgi:S-DNA-T family DNA segregation ATPase FtsK/SpoIIIE